MFWRRYGIYLLAYVLIVGAFASMQVWKYVDFALMERMLGESHELDPEVVVIDLNAHLGAIRGPLAGVLETICEPASDTVAHVRCTRPANVLPRLIILDVEFIQSGGTQAEVARLARVIEGLHAANVRIYGAILPSNDPGAQAGQSAGQRTVDPLYTLLTGYGHTQLWVIPFLGGFAWYEPEVATASGTQIEALPLTIVRTARQSARPTALRETRIVPLGSHQDFLQSLHMYPLPHSFAFANDDWVLIGDDLGEREYASKGGQSEFGARSGFELLAWALVDEKDRTQMETASGAPVYEPRVDVALMLILLVAFSLLAVVAYRQIFARIRTRRYSYTVSLLGAILIALAGLAALEVVLVSNRQLFSQVTLVAAGIVTASALTARWTVVDVRHRRFLTSLWAGAAKVAETDQFDIFISYARNPENAAWVEANVYRPLSQKTDGSGRPLRIFFDRETLIVGSEWYKRIVGAIYGSRIFVAVYSGGYFGRWFCRDELELAMLRATHDSPFIVPLSRVGGAVPRRYAGIHFIDVASDPNFIDDVLARLREAEG